MLSWIRIEPSRQPTRTDKHREKKRKRKIGRLWYIYIYIYIYREREREKEREREREIEKLSAIDWDYFPYSFDSSIHLANHFYLSIDLSDYPVAL